MHFAIIEILIDLYQFCIGKHSVQGESIKVAQKLLNYAHVLSFVYDINKHACLLVAVKNRAVIHFVVIMAVPTAI